MWHFIWVFRGLYNGPSYSLSKSSIGLYDFYVCMCMYVFLSILLVVPYVGLWTAIVESPDHIQLLFF